MAPRSSVVIATVLSLVCVPHLCAQQAPADPPQIRLPEPDPRIQAWLAALTGGPRAGGEDALKSYFEPLAQAMAALQDKTITDREWFTQVLLFVSQKEGEQAWVMIIQLMLHSRTIMGLQPRSAIPALAPYLEHPQPSVARSAREMIAYSIGFSGQPFSNAMQEYFRTSRPGEPSWKVVTFFFSSSEPDDALSASASAYLDRPTQQQIERMRKELTILIYSHDLAEADRQTELSRQIAAKLDEFARHAHWSVRAYVPAKLVKERGSSWSRDPATLAILTRLTEDLNPAIVELSQSAGRLFRIR